MKIPMLFIYIFLLILLMAFIIFNSTSIGIEKVDCYDKNGNKIIGVSCEQEINKLSNYGVIILPIILILFFLVIYELIELHVIEFGFK